MSAQPFERYPALASWIERLGNTPGVMSLGDWTVFVGALNNALTRAEGPAPVSAPLDREGVARIIDPDGFARREQHLRVSAEWHEKAEKFAATENPAPYPDGRFAVERIVEAWRGVAEKHATYAETDVRHAYAKADAILALSQQVGLTTPAVLGEPSADALRSGDWRPIESAPGETWVIVRTQFGRVFKAHLGPGYENDDGSCWGWAVDDGDPHPDCWSDGVCWRSNEDDEPSDQPVAWMALPIVQAAPTRTPQVPHEFREVKESLPAPTEGEGETPHPEGGQT